MKKSDIVDAIFRRVSRPTLPQIAENRGKGTAFAPANIALCKYWGKRDTELNLPVTSSLSISLKDKGATTHVSLHTAPHDVIMLNGNEVARSSSFAERTTHFLDLFRADKQWHLRIDINMNIPVAAGLASSACGFASLLLALNDLFDWRLAKRDLSILARLGSGSASRSLWNGFVEWHAGVLNDGMDSYSEPLPYEWPELCVGLLTLSQEQKYLSSREAMQRTTNSSILYENWPRKVGADLAIIKQALRVHNFSLLAGTAESNALTMHATMLSSWPPICYFLPETIAAMHQIWKLRHQGLEVYFTQDAGPNLKLLFLERDIEPVKKHFPNVDIIQVFKSV